MTRDTPPPRVRLHFDCNTLAGDEVHLDISTATRAGAVLFLSCDESAGIERLTPQGDGGDGWGNHRHIALGEIFDLPGEETGEIDIEGLAVDGDWLWITGSQALKRGKPKDGDTPARALERMAEVKWDENRQLLARMPLEHRADGAWPVKEVGGHRAAMLKPRKDFGRLRKWLTDDPHLAAFLQVPSKDNGLDIEGIAARGDRVWLGLRGPVLRGYTLILEMRMRETGEGYLKPCKIDGDRRYRKHLLPMEGHGVRDLAFDGDDLLVLTGTPLDSGGRSEIWRWRNALAVTGSGVWPSEEVSMAKALPYRGNTDNPEGLTAWEDGQWLIAHDSPEAHRVGEGAWLDVDVWRLDG